MRGLKNVSIIVPFALEEQAGERLFEQLRELAPEAQCIGVGPRRPSFDLAGATWVEAAAGRALQLNAGAAAASRQYMWFLHADSYLSPRCPSALEAALARRPEALVYFDLKFDVDGPKLMALNRAGVWVRSHLLGMPFGDQGFCVAREVFDRVGGFPTNAAYGEDHLFVWRARQAGVPLLGARSTITTSARKYARRGWLKTTVVHGVLAFRQAYPEWKKLLAIKGNR